MHLWYDFMRGGVVGHLCSGCFKWILSQDFENGHFKIVHFSFPGTEYHPKNGLPGISKHNAAKNGSADICLTA